MRVSGRLEGTWCEQEREQRKPGQYDEPLWGPPNGTGGRHGLKWSSRDKTDGTRVRGELR